MRRRQGLLQRAEPSIRSRVSAVRSSVRHSRCSMIDQSPLPPTPTARGCKLMAFCRCRSPPQIGRKLCSWCLGAPAIRLVPANETTAKQPPGARPPPMMFCQDGYASTLLKEAHITALGVRAGRSRHPLDADSGGQRHRGSCEWRLAFRVRRALV